MKTAFITHQDCLLHEMGSYHPESPFRLSAIQEHLEATGLLAQLCVMEAEPVSREALERAHSIAHVTRIMAASPAAGLVQIDPDTAMCPDSLRAAQLAAGALVQAVDGICAGQYQRAFCAVRPPGHHAEHDASMGFCLFNNIAVGVRHAMAAHGIERAAILDFDVHHGNGTVDIFKDDPAVLVCSSFQHPFYPGRYVDIDRPNIVNTPLPAGTNGCDFRIAVERAWTDAIDAHRPQMVFVSAGFDAHRDDPLAQLNLVEEDYAWVTELCCAAAERHAQGRVVSTLEGGYDPQALARSVHAHISVLANT